MHSMGYLAWVRRPAAAGVLIQGLRLGSQLGNVGTGHSSFRQPLVHNLVDWSADAFGLADVAEGGEAPRASLGRPILRQLADTGRCQPPAPDEGVSRARRGPYPIVEPVRPPVGRFGIRGPNLDKPPNQQSGRNAIRCIDRRVPLSGPPPRAHSTITQPRAARARGVKPNASDAWRASCACHADAVPSKIFDSKETSTATVPRAVSSHWVA